MRRKKKSPLPIISSPPDSPSPQTSSASHDTKTPVPPQNGRFIKQFTFEYENAADNICKSFIEAFQMDIRKIMSEAKAKEVSSSPNLHEVFVTDPGPTDLDHEGTRRLCF